MTAPAIGSSPFDETRSTASATKHAGATNGPSLPRRAHLMMHREARSRAGPSHCDSGGQWLDAAQKALGSCIVRGRPQCL